ncbi:DnaJ C-terminal domain-containing protein [Paludibacterium yongneupense]|uniref:DnaJ C-terminal domain-containing protein n=1 Tax=Paludibacterium yongneupense TaxID=400061 RepID=UPI0004211061|nr:DnaJ C-terminal domain-containing protein [Paludibacterium yongneupense]
MQFQDYYQTLGVARDATQDDIKRAYRKLARKFHPDVSKEADAEVRFKALGEAYAVLKDPEKRAAYDQMGSEWKTGQDFRPPPGWDAGFEFSGSGFETAGSGEYSDFFEALFGRAGAGRGTHAKGRDRHAKVVIDLADAYRGAQRSIVMQVPQRNAQGRVQLHERTLDVAIPRGVRAGQHLRLAGQGEPGAGGGAAGDLYLEIDFAEHPLFRADGADVFLDLPLAPWEAALGAAVDVPTPTGTVRLTIPPGSEAGKRLRLKGRGIPAATVGDLYAVLTIVLPPAARESERQAYQAFARAFDFDPRARLKG